MEVNVKDLKKDFAHSCFILKKKQITTGKLCELMLSEGELTLSEHELLKRVKMNIKRT